MSFESRITDLLDKQACSEQPPARVSIGTAIRHGNTRLRWRRAGLASATPALTGVALALIALIGPVLISGHATGTPPAGYQAASGSPAAQTGSLPILRTSARFGWLPLGQQLRSGMQSADMAYMNIGEGKVFDWSLTVWAPSRCVRGSGANGKLLCQFGAGVAPARYPVADRAPSIGGHEAFWISSRQQHQQITWEYAPGAWAVFGSPSCCSAAANRQPSATLLRIARQVTFGPATGQPLSFDFQLTDIPADWHLSSVSYGVQSGSLLADAIDVTGQQNSPTKVSVLLSHAGSGNSDPCWTTAAGLTKHITLRGYDVETTTVLPSYSDEGSDTYQLCAPNVRGTGILISASGHAGRTPADLFNSMRFLGPDRANWTSNPIG